MMDYNGHRMNKFQHHWYRIHPTIRKPLVLVIGMLLVIISPFTGVLPGPGGIPIFLIGVAILSTEFEWAKRLRDWTLDQVHRLGDLWKQHKVIGTFILIVCAAAVMIFSIFAFRWMKTII